MEIKAKNVNEAVFKGLSYLLKDGIEETSRNGTVIVAPEPVMTIYERPTERVLFSPLRDANPFFHLFESLWMLAGRWDIDYPVQFNKKFAAYGDEDMLTGQAIQWGAYGYRWREFFGFDQLRYLIAHLKDEPNTRRAVLSMWAPLGDLVCCEGGMGGLNMKDVPCNTGAYFDRRGGVLNMTVLCRSNDAIWGAYGANVVHLSILQEYIASVLGVPVGVYRQFSNNFHAYTDIYDRDKLRAIALEADRTNLYDLHSMKPSALISSHIQCWDHDNIAFLEEPLSVARHDEDPFFTNVAKPMYRAWSAHKSRDYDAAISHALDIEAEDWRVVCVQWLDRRQRKFEGEKS